jgi:hypothetical protein
MNYLLCSSNWLVEHPESILAARQFPIQLSRGVSTFVPLAISVTAMLVRVAARNRISLIGFGQASASTQMCMA